MGSHQVAVFVPQFDGHGPCSEIDHIVAVQVLGQHLAGVVVIAHFELVVVGEHIHMEFAVGAQDAELFVSSAVHADIGIRVAAVRFGHDGRAVPGPEMGIGELEGNVAGVADIDRLGSGGAQEAGVAGPVGHPQLAVAQEAAVEERQEPAVGVGLVVGLFPAAGVDLCVTAGLTAAAAVEQVEDHEGLVDVAGAGQVDGFDDAVKPELDAALEQAGRVG